MRASAKQLVLTLAKGCSLFAVVRGLTRSCLRVLAYHGVEPRAGIDNADGFQVDPEVFTCQMEHLARCYRAVSLDEVFAAYNGGAPLPPRAALVTFDDGYLNNAEIAAPILKRLGIPAAFFFTTGFLDRTHVPWWYVVRGWIARAGVARIGLPNMTDSAAAKNPRLAIALWEHHLKGMAEELRQETLRRMSAKLDMPIEADIPFMSWEHARQMHAQGFALGAHTVSHSNLGVEGETVIKTEIESSIARIAAETGVRVTAFAYPYGREGDIQSAVDPILRSNRIALGFTTVHGLNADGSPPLRLRRLNVTNHYAGPAFEKLLALGR